MGRGKNKGKASPETQRQGGIGCVEQCPADGVGKKGARETVRLDNIGELGLYSSHHWEERGERR